MHIDQDKPNQRRGFTLVELLVVISIVALLSVLMLGALYTAQDAAKAQKTRSTIAKLHTLLMQRYELYQTRRVPVTIPSGATPTQAATLRLNGLRELMRMELPDRLSDVIELTSPYNTTPVLTTGMSVPSITEGYARRLRVAFSSKPPGDPADGNYPYKNQSSELLYMILSTPSPEDDSPLENFGQSEVADTDNNGLPEFVDAWGVPIQWIRWPTAFRSDLQSGNPVDQPDPFDTRRIDPASFAIYPLIYSGGPDKIYDIKGNRDLDDATTPFTYYGQNNNPFAGDTGTTGSVEDINSDVNISGVKNFEENWQDNIHNHLIGTR